MLTIRKKQTYDPGRIWLISNSGLIKPSESCLYPDIQATSATEYFISDIARYMLNPNPIEIPKKLIGCEVYPVQPAVKRFKDKLKKLLPKKKGESSEEKDVPKEILLALPEIKAPSQKDNHFVSHINRINESLRPFDPLPAALAKLDQSSISDIIGICDDIDGSRSNLNIRGDIENKIKYINQFHGKDVGVILANAHISKGLFEMRGFDFTSYDPNRSHRLVKYIEDGKPKACVFSTNHKVDYYIEDFNVISYMHILDQAIKANRNFHDSIYQCITGKATPLKILFNKQFEIDYSKTALPKVYQSILDACEMGSTDRKVVASSLNQMQFGIAFSYVPDADTGQTKLFTHITVMHNVRALDPIKDNLPELYSEINKRATISEAGHFYMLDSIRGYINA